MTRTWSEKEKKKAREFDSSDIFCSIKLNKQNIFKEQRTSLNEWSLVTSPYHCIRNKQANRKQFQWVNSCDQFLPLYTSTRSCNNCVRHFRYHHLSRHRSASPISPSLPHLHFTSPAAIPTCHGENGVVIRILKISPHSCGVAICMQVGQKIFAGLFRQLEKQIELADWVGN